ncbi:MAG: CoA-binding protein [Thermodesulfobacteriota bacterium]|nr:CoA-binding protein [Thermodesulfobacteriota bacterium]
MTEVLYRSSFDPPLHNAVEGLDFLFHPESIALVGVSSNNDSPINGMFLTPLLEFGFKGRLYLVNPRGGEIMSMKVYPSIKDIPGKVDYVISTVPAKYSIRLIEDCIVKGVKAIAFYTAGFSETSKMEGIVLEERITKLAREGEIRVVGPNCMGIYCPSAGLSYWPEFPKESGKVACLCQSGGNSIHLVWMGVPRGIRFSKVISFGNAVDIDESELIDYFAHDPDTEIIAAYIEGIKDGKRFLKALGDAAKMKPVIMLKAGCSESGTRAAAGHTGSMAGDDSIWDALCKQMGIVRVLSMEELTDMIVTFLFMPPIQGRNAGIVTVGGGVSVLAADECERYGLHVPPLDREIKDRLCEFTPIVGNILRNPVDSQLVFSDQRQFANTIKIISEWNQIDFLISPLIGGVPLPSGPLMAFDVIADTIPQWNTPSLKPIAMIVQASTRPEIAHNAFLAQERFASAGFPVYPTVGRAANAISKFIEYHRIKKI